MQSTQERDHTPSSIVRDNISFVAFRVSVGKILLDKHMAYIHLPDETFNWLDLYSNS